MTWSKDAYDIAAVDNNAWSGVYENEAVPDDYLEKYKPLLEENLVRAAWRLSY